MLEIMRTLDRTMWSSPQLIGFILACVLTAVTAEQRSALKWQVRGYGVDKNGNGAIQGWGVLEVQFFSDRGCTKQIEIDPSTIIASGEHPGFKKAAAFDGNIKTKWGGRQNGQIPMVHWKDMGFWIGASLKNGKQVVECAKVLQQSVINKYYAPNVDLDRYNEETNTYSTVATQKNIPVAPHWGRIVQPETTTTTTSTTTTTMTTTTTQTATTTPTTTKTGAVTGQTETTGVVTGQTTAPVNAEASATTTTSAPDNTAGIAIAVVLVILVIASAVSVAIYFMLKKRTLNVAEKPAAADAENPERHERSATEVARELAGNLKATDFDLNSNDVKRGKIIARGGGGQIYAGTFSGQPVALKESIENDDLVREAAMMTKLRHPNIVQFFGIWQPDDEENPDGNARTFLVMELCPNGDLQDAAKDPDHSLANRKMWILQVASAMQYLHSRKTPVIHRDLKPQNVLLDGRSNAKVCDFGLSKAEENDRDMTAGVGTVAYMAPELMDPDADAATKLHMDGTKCDVFSFAILALYVATGAEPYKGLSRVQIYFKVKGEGEQRMDIPKTYAGISPENQEEGSDYDAFVALVQKMWMQEPSERPAFEEIVNTLKEELQWS